MTGGGAEPDLRLVDWRFLLAMAAPKRVFCRAGEPLLGALRAVADEVVTQEPPAGSCDLGVVGSARPNEVETAWRALAPGGYLVVLGSGLRGRPGRDRRALERRGFESIRPYWSWPAGRNRRPQIWAPVNDARALEHLAERPSATSRARRRLATPALRALSCAGALRPVTLLARKPGTPAATDLTAAIHQVCPARPPELPLDAILLTGGRHPANKVVALLMGGSADPALALKFARVPDSVAALEHEYEVLRHLASRPQTATAVVPLPLFSAPLAGSVAVASTVVEGAPLWSVRDGMAAGRPQAVGRWLATLVDDRITPAGDWRRRLVEAPLERFRAAHAGLVSDAVTGTIRELAGSLPDLPLAVEHRDCSPWNLMLDPDGRLVVLDWESAELRGLPARDLEYFLLHWAWFAGGKTTTPAAALREIRDPATDRGHIAAGVERRYVEQTGVPAEALPALRLLTWTHHAVSEHARELASRGAQAGPPPGTFLSLLREEIRLLA